MCLCVYVWFRRADGLSEIKTHTQGRDQAVSAVAVNEQMSLKLTVTLLIA